MALSQRKRGLLQHAAVCASASTLGDRDDLRALHRLLARSGRAAADPRLPGRPVLTLQPDAGVEPATGSLTRGLLRQHEGHVDNPYVDVWAAVSAPADALGAEHAWR